MRNLELLAPARNLEIGKAAIDCGADAVYIAGPAFGARQAAGNTMADVRSLCDYAHRFGARIFLTLNTILYDDELQRARAILDEAKDAGVDAVIAQDLSLLELSPLPLHASTQCAIRTPEKAKFYESLGFGRLVLEREMSLEGIKAVREAVDCELEFFVHGALCVCYSGQCYLSERISGRSANRGECAQACRSLYDLADASGKTLAKDKALLSLKDYNLIHRLEDLAESGIVSFKIEGRLKNASYVKNVTRAYSEALDALVAKYPAKYRRASFGRVTGGFTPNLDKTFNRGYTELFLDGRRNSWSSMDAPKSMGEEIGTVTSVRQRGEGFEVSVRLKDPNESLRNGDGFSFVAGGEAIGFRGDVCEGSRIRCKAVPGLVAGVRLFRNISAAFEKELENSTLRRLLAVDVDISVKDGVIRAAAHSEDGRLVSLESPTSIEKAKNAERMREAFNTQISKATSVYSFALRSLDGDDLPFTPASAINAIRRELAALLDSEPCHVIPVGSSVQKPGVAAPKELDYKANVSNSIARDIYRSKGAGTIGKAYELIHVKGAELMRTKYCVRYELGLCPVRQGAKSSGPLYLLNNGKRYALAFDCEACEMTVSTVE